MAIPEGYTPLAKIGISYKGDYVDGATYSQLDAVFYAGSTYLAVIDNPVGVPNNGGQNWRYLAQGAGEDVINLLGKEDISDIADGTLTGAVRNLADNPVDPSRWLSLEEYNALSEEEKMNGTVYRVYDANADGNAYTMPFTSDLYEAENTGDALVEVKTSISDMQIVTEGTVTALVGTSANYTHIKKIGLIKKLQFLFTGVSVAKATWVEIGQVSSDFYPSEILMFNIRDDSGNVYGGRLTTDGKIGVISQVNALTNINLAGEVVYF